MHGIVIPSLYLLAGIMVYATVHHLTIALSPPRQNMQLIFACMCLLAVPFAISHAQILQATNTAEFVLALKWNLASLILFFILLPWFAALYSEKRPSPRLAGLSLLFAVLFVVNLVQPYSLQYRQFDGIRTLELPWGEMVTRGIGHNGFWGYLTIAGALITFGYVLYVFGSVCLRHRRPTDMWMLAAAGLFLLSGSEGILVRLSIIDFIEFGPIGILAMAIVMSVALTHKTQKRLSDSERHFRLLFENLPIGMVAIDPQDGHIMQANQSALKLTGYGAEEFLTKGMDDLSLPDELADSRQRFEQLSKGLADHIYYEKRYLKKDGSSFLGYSSISTLKDDKGKVMRLIGSTIDITERKQTENALRESETRFRTIIEQSPIGIAFARDGYTVDVNEVYLQMFGYEDISEVRGQPVINQIAPQCRAEAKDRAQRRMQGETAETSYEIIGLRKDGSQFPLLVTAKRVVLSDGPLTFTFLIDITERKQSEASLKESEIRFRTIIEQSPMGMALGRDGVTVEVNPVYLKMFGYDDIAQVRGQPLTNQIAPQCRAEIEERIRRRTRGEPTEDSYESIGLRKDGSQFPLYISAKRVMLNDGPMTFAFLIDFTERKAAEARINHLAFYDHLTELPNRRLLIDRLQRALTSGARRDQYGALLFIDLDNFKTLNDTLGHVTGDLLLQQVAQRLVSCVREEDSVARFGGDEFVVILEDLSGNALDAAAQTETIGGKILAALNQPYHLAAHEYHCTTSIGATLFHDNRQTTDELLKQADIAMYQSKKAGRNILRFFDPLMQDTINARAALERKLHRALEKRQFHLHYQIQIDSSGIPIGAEALIRWTHPENGLVPPAQFIPLAEDTGLIVPIGEWVLETVCAQLKDWENDELTSKLVLSVNISAKQFLQADFAAQTQAVMQRYAITPELLELELTESMLLENIEETILTMDRLRRIGVRFSLDDFGSGYSSLQYLKRLPLDQLKIDQSFVRDIAFDSSDRAIVSTIIAMAKSLDLDVIAEGVETEEQRDFLLNKGCIHYQGYLFSKPVPIEQFEAMLRYG
jgi:diguanylate cyclase (GGDEF)-like protein/PAS domain S-box-containing protein